MHRPYQLSGSIVGLSGTLCGECALLLSVHSNSITRISPVLPSQSRTLTLSTHRALSLGRVLLEPFHNAMLFPSAVTPPPDLFITDHMEVVPAFARDWSCVRFEKSRRRKEGARTQDAIISGVFASRTCTIKVDLADTADVVVGDIPSPSSYRIPFPDLDLHLDCLPLNSVYIRVRCSIRRLEEKA
jgi:hypothetical protein